MSRRTSRREMLRVAQAIDRGYITRSSLLQRTRIEAGELSGVLQRLREEGWLDSTHARQGRPAQYRLTTDLATIEQALEVVRSAPDASALMAAWPMPVAFPPVPGRPRRVMMGAAE